MKENKPTNKQKNKQTKKKTKKKTNWRLKCYHNQILNTFDFRLIGS